MNATPAGLRHILEDPAALEVFSGKKPWILVLDYDGTLAPFRPEREHAYPYAGMRDVLNRLPASGRSRFILISGREAGVVSRLLNIQPEPEIWGCHGAQRLAPGRDPQQADLTPGQKAALARARSMVDDASLLEVKSCGVAIHWRGLPDEERLRLEAGLLPDLRPLAEESGLELHSFDGGLELRLPDINKGAVIETLLQENPEALLFYFGDDKTDEDAFKALKGRGIGVLVKPEPRPTNASFWVRPPQELLTLIGRFAILNPHKRRMQHGA
ncbi:MAG: trehalose-phosphatase [Acidobacteriota bacterium]